MKFPGKIRYRIGNIITALLSIVDAIIMILLLGYPLKGKYCLHFQWIFWKLKHPKLFGTGGEDE